MKFYDTCALLTLQEDAFTEPFWISDVTLSELENIKTSKNKTDEIKYQARHVSRLLDQHFGEYNMVFWDQALKTSLDSRNDTKIIECVLYVIQQGQEITFVSDDICAKNVARSVGIPTEGVDTSCKEEYTGYVEVSLTEEEMAYFYSHLTENVFELLPNQYLLLKDSSDKIVDKLLWDGEMYQNVKIPNMKSEYFGTVKPFKGDIYQQCAMNCLARNQVSMLKGPAGTGKSYLALGYLFSQLEKNKIDKIVIFCNTVATANAAKLGYYPGTKDEKLQDSAIGNMLGAKLGGKEAVDRLIDDEKLVLIPMSDIRGYDSSGLHAGIYITEAQNMDISLMKLALQRIGEDSICIIDGDYNAQVDLAQYVGSNNGMRRMSEVFRGEDFYGEVELRNIYRSKIAAVAELM